MRTYKFLFSILLLLSLTTTQSNAQIVAEGKSIASLGYGFPNLGVWKYSIISSVYDNLTTKGFGPIHMKYEYMVTDEIGVGASFNLANFKVNYTQQVDSFDFGNPYFQITNYQIKNTNYSFLLRVNYHFSMDDDNLDLYAGAALGYRGAKIKFTSNPTDLSFEPKLLVPLGFEATFGARYFFTEQIGAYAEVGLSKSILQIGVCAALGKD